MGTEKKKIYHPFTYPPICAHCYGRAPSCITFAKTILHTRLGSDVRVWFCRNMRHLPLLWIATETYQTTAFTVSRVLRIGIAPSPTLCAFFARLLSSSQSLDFLHNRFYYKYFKMSIPFGTKRWRATRYKASRPW